MKIKKLIRKIGEISDSMGYRDISDILPKLMEEVGELATEVAIQDGLSNKTPGDDGVPGEVIDVVIVALDILYRHNPNITQKEIVDIIETKLQKWKWSLE